MKRKRLLSISNALCFLLVVVSSYLHAQQKDSASCQPPIKVDGLLNEPAWINAKKQITKAVKGVSDGVTAEFKTCFDNQYLYIGARVKDGQLYNQAGNVWENSSVEVFLDVDHNHSTTYDSNDFQYIAVWKNAVPWEKNGRTTGVLQATYTDSQVVKKTTQFGVYCGNSVSAVQTYENWLGTKCDGILGYVGNASWSDMDPGWSIGNWSPIDRRVFWSMPLIPNGASLADAAAGNRNALYKAYATKLAQYRPQDSVLYIRTAWEFNGDWFPWSAIGKEQDFIGAWRQFVNSFRSVSTRFRFDWCPSLCKCGMSKIEDAYPGDAYVDIIGMDYYDETAWCKITNPIVRWDSMLNQAYGLAWHRDFAKAHGKQMSYPEWGVGGAGSGDNPYFVQQMSKWLADNKVVYGSYWNSNAGYAGQLDNNQYPNAGAEYKKDFGPNASNTAGSYSMEIAIPWTTLGVVPSKGLVYGFDVGININHSNGSRTGHLMWNGDENNSQNTSLFGDLFIKDICPVATGTQSNDFKPEMLVYPNPAKENIQLSFTSKSKGSMNVTIMDAQMRMIQEHSVEIRSGLNQLELSTAELANGFYMISMDTPYGNMQKKIVVNR